MSPGCRTSGLADGTMRGAQKPSSCRAATVAVDGEIENRAAQLLGLSSKDRKKAREDVVENRENGRERGDLRRSGDFVSLERQERTRSWGWEKEGETDPLD